MKINEIKNNWALRTSTNIGVSNKELNKYEQLCFKPQLFFTSLIPDGVIGNIMRLLAILILSLYMTPAFGQNKNCFCEKDSLMNQSVIECDTTKLSNGSKLFWQYNCDRIWFTLENAKGNRVVLDEVDVKLYGYTYRLGYHLIKEYKNSLLFRSGCGATGPCDYILIDKANGAKLKELSNLICVDTDAQWDSSYAYPFDFIVYLSDSSNNLMIYYIDNKKKLTVPFKEKLTAAIPEQQFDKMTLNKNILTIYYETDEREKSQMKIDLSDKKYCR
ncbi:MAG: hypothetical protein ABI723_11080 [Bacteroidia bacterium]